MSRTVTTFLHQGLVEFPASTRMNSSPAIFTVILQTGNISTEKWSKFSPTTGPLTFITQPISNPPGPVNSISKVYFELIHFSLSHSHHLSSGYQQFSLGMLQLLPTLTYFQLLPLPSPTLIHSSSRNKCGLHKSDYTSALLKTLQ